MVPVRRDDGELVPLDHVRPCMARFDAERAEGRAVEALGRRAVPHPNPHVVETFVLIANYHGKRGAIKCSENGRVATRLPAQDLERAKAFYAEKLGLEPVEEREGGLRYVCAAGEFALFESAGGRPAGDHTQMGWEVDDIEETVRELRARGVVFEEYDFPGLETVDGIADIEGNYPSKGSGERGAWFRDSEGNMLGVGQPLRG